MGDERSFAAPPGPEARRSAPAALRNREPIAEVLADWLPATGLVLEVASGSGEHALYFARRFSHLDWQPTDPDPQALASIAAWRATEPLPNLRAPVALDASAAEWPVPAADAVLAINMVHIAPWDAALGLISGAARLLAAGAPLILYGPWFVEGLPTAPSNLAFDADLRARDSRWGIRRVSEFAAAAEHQGFDLAGERPMPANNYMLLFRRRAGFSD